MQEYRMADSLIVWEGEGDSNFWRVSALKLKSNWNKSKQITKPWIVEHKTLYFSLVT